MKKWFIYISISTVLILFMGVLFVYGAFDFSNGKAQLIGPTSKESEEKVLHDKIVLSLNDIGNQMQELAVFSITDDLAAAQQKINSFKSKYEHLQSFFENYDFTKRQEPIKNVFLDSYKPAMTGLLNRYDEAIAFYTENEITEENKGNFSKSIKTASDALIKAHNDYIVVINAKRKY